jgi:hypothetical protein
LEACDATAGMGCPDLLRLGSEYRARRGMRDDLPAFTVALKHLNPISLPRRHVRSAYFEVKVPYAITAWPPLSASTRSIGMVSVMPFLFKAFTNSAFTPTVLPNASIAGSPTCTSSRRLPHRPCSEPPATSCARLRSAPHPILGDELRGRLSALGRVRLGGRGGKHHKQAQDVLVLGPRSRLVPG